MEDGGEVITDLVERPPLLPRRPLPCTLHLLVAFLEIPGRYLAHTAHIPEGGGGRGGEERRRGRMGEWEKGKGRKTGVRRRKRDEILKRLVVQHSNSTPCHATPHTVQTEREGREEREERKREKR